MPYVAIEEKVGENHGNFFQLVTFRALTDDALREHLQNAPRNALYTQQKLSRKS